MTSLLLGTAAGLLGPPSVGAQEEEAPVHTEVPDACELLGRSEAAELLGEEVGEGERIDTAGFPCVYRTPSGRQLSIVVHIGRGPTLGGTQPGIELEYCRAEAVQEFDELGLGAVLFRNANETCGNGDRLWVPTGVRFRGRTNPDLVREINGQFHLMLSIEPVESVDERFAILRSAARTVLDRLRGR